MSERYEVCPASELPPGDRIITDLDGDSVGVFNVDGEYHALKNVCPHQRAPLCEGKVTGTVSASEPGEESWERDGQVLRCPWHGWEFDITDGKSVFNPHRVKARSYEATTEAPADAPDGEDADCSDCGVELEGDGPPVDTYDVAVEDELVVVYV
jgi:nitrite reductase/ring-hydroxylating ferredoxin subunit